MNDELKKLVDFSLSLLEDFERQNFDDLYRNIRMVQKNLRDMKKILEGRT